MFNTIQNDTENILILDLRSVKNIVRSHINFDLQNSSNVPLPLDLIENMSDFKTIFDNQILRKYDLINDKKLLKFKNKKRSYVFIIASEHKEVSTDFQNVKDGNEDEDSIS